MCSVLAARKLPWKDFIATLGPQGIQSSVAVVRRRHMNFASLNRVATFSLVHAGYGSFDNGVSRLLFHRKLQGDSCTMKLHWIYIVATLIALPIEFLHFQNK
jgi:hypothetical protein